MKRALLLLTVLCLCLSIPRVSLADDTASIAYQQAEELAKQNKWAEACPLYESSYRADPQIGVLLHLADCHEHVGRLASAWAEFTDAVELAHRKGDNREAFAQGRADALKPKLARLHLTPPPSPPPGLAVHRDGVDVTVFVGTDAPIDPGEHELVATAPGYLEWRKKITIGTLATTTTLDIPALEKAPVTEPAKPAEPKPGTLAIAAQGDAQIVVDDQPPQTGHFEAQVKPGRHVVHVTAPGMHAYQTEVVVLDGENRSIDVALEKEAPVYVAPPPGEELPTFTLAASMSPGVKLRNGDPATIAYRVEGAFRIGRRVDLGVYAEYGTIDTSTNCGFDSMLGANQGSPYDIGTHYQLNSCAYLMPGLLLFVHARPTSTLDPIFGITPAFRFGFTDFTPYLANMPGKESSEVFPAIVTGIHAGVDYHPRPDYRAWGIGAYVEDEVTIYGQETCDQCQRNNKGQTFMSLFAGVRSTLAF